MAQVLRRFAEHHRSEDPNLLLGLDAPDDAAVYRISDDLALAQTVDFFTPIVDDPYTWGAIAAANSLSDIYAMGAEPKLALNLVGWPKELDFDLLARVLEGGADKAAEAGVAIVGGHTVDDPEPKYGMAVTGFVHPDKAFRASLPGPGLSLVLTKPLSMGVVSTAVKRGEAPARLAEEASAVMSALNAPAAAAMIEAGAAAATDVTGFGLLGHLHNMARRSPAGVTLWLESVPVLDGVGSLIEAGLVPGGTRRNEAYFGDYVDFEEGITPGERTLLFDAQTSGGLLIGIATGRESDLVAALEERGTPAAAVVGATGSGPAGRIAVRRKR